MITVERLSKQYGSKRALEDISFSVPKGQVLGLLGLNGAGKSTTMNILAGCLSPTSGRVVVDGIELARDARAAKRKIGYLPEIPPLYLDMKTAEFLGFVHELKGLKTNKRKELAAISERAGVAGVQSRVIKNLSKGYRQRVGLAAAMLGSPELLILDEPTVGLDPTQIIEIRGLIAEIGAERTVILSSHILSEVQAVCRRVIVLDNGRLAADDTPEQLGNAMQSKSCVVAAVEGAPHAVLEALRGCRSVVSAEQLSRREEGVYAYKIQGERDADIRREVFRALAAADLPMLSTHSAQVSLEDVFLKLVGGEGGGAQ